MVLDDGGESPCRFENAFDAGTTPKLDTLADLGTGSNADPAVNHAAVACDMGANVDEPQVHHHRLWADVRSSAHHAARCVTHPLAFKLLGGVVCSFEGHLVPIAAGHHFVGVSAKIVQHPVDGVGLRLPDPIDFFGGPDLSCTQKIDERIAFLLRCLALSDGFQQVGARGFNGFDPQSFVGFQVQQKLDFLMPPRILMGEFNVLAEDAQTLLCRRKINASLLVRDLPEHPQWTALSGQVGHEGNQFVLGVVEPQQHGLVGLRDGL